MLTNNVYLQHCASLALEASTRELFQSAFVESTCRFVGARGGHMTTYRPDGSYVISTDLDDLGPFRNAVFGLMAEVTREETAATLSSATRSHEEAFSRARLDELAFFREYLPSLTSNGSVFRGWSDSSGCFHSFAFVCPPGRDFRIFQANAVSALDQVFPIVALAHRVFNATEAQQTEMLFDAAVTECRLTNSERATLALALRGLTNDEIARLQDLSPRTVRNRLSAAYAKLRVSSRAEATYIVMSTRAHPAHCAGDPVRRHVDAVRECLSR